MKALGDALLALVPTTKAPVFEGTAPEGSKPPWKVVSLTLPNPDERGLTRGALSHLVRVRVTCTAASAGGVRTLFGEVVDAVEGARVAAAGWSSGPLELFNTRPPEVDRDGVVDVMWGVLEFRATVTTAGVA